MKINNKIWYIFLTFSGLVVVAILFFLFTLILINTRANKIVLADEIIDGQYNVAIVFGAGLKGNNTPSDMLRDRLIVASQLFHDGKVQHLLVSGDNRFINYNEPEVMKRTLIQDYNVPAEAIIADYAGRRTYDTCIRANTLWGVEKAILVTQAYHLPRAIYTCERLGVSGVGVSASLRNYVGQLKFDLREALAMFRSFIDVNIIAPTYVGGEFINNIDS